MSDYLGVLDNLADKEREMLRSQHGILETVTLENHQQMNLIM